MEENIIVNDENLDAVKDNFTPPGTKDNENPSAEGTEDTVTLTKDELSKKIQSAEDKVRGKLSKQIRDLETKVKELTPVEKTQAEIDLEERIARLEVSEKEVASQKRRLDIQEQLSSKGLDEALVDYIKDDVDVDALSAIIESMAKVNNKNNGFIPNEHGSDDSITPEEYKKMSYSEKKAFMEKHPEAYRRLKKKI